MASVLIVPGQATPAATPHVEAPADAPCLTGKTMEDVLKSAAYEEARAALALEPGFIDLLIGHDGAFFSATAYFDATLRDDDLAARVLDVAGIPVRYVGDRFVTLPASATLGVPPVIPQECAGEIRPGQRMTSPGLCTFSHVYRDAQGRFYIATAGHCTSTNARAHVEGLGAIGTVVYSTGDGGVGTDFALVRIDPEREHLVNPAMCHWGGPTGMWGGDGLIAHHYGHGDGFGATQFTRPRVGAGVFTSPTSFSFTGAIIFGDSGSAANHGNGPALGTITHLGLGTGVVFGTSAPRGVALVESALGLELELQVAPLGFP